MSLEGYAPAPYPVLHAEVLLHRLTLRSGSLEEQAYAFEIPDGTGDQIRRYPRGRSNPLLDHNAVFSLGDCSQDAEAV